MKPKCSCRAKFKVRQPNQEPRKGYMTTCETSAMRKLAAHPTTPEWARDILEGSTASVGPAVTSAEVDLHTIDSSYLAFLRDQIKSSPRGPKWSRLLSERLEALASLIGEPL